MRRDHTECLARTRIWRRNAPARLGRRAGCSQRSIAPFRGVRIGDHVPAIDGRHRVRRYWFGGGPIFAPDPSVEYVYGADDYDDGGDPTGCSVFHKAYDSAGRFLGFVLVDLCEGR